MNKKKFLKLLEEKLQILSEEERNDILNEYKDTIEEKVKHGSSEEEAVADFGSIEELSREILKAYKINPDYTKNKDTSSKEKMKDIANQSESLIKEGAEKLSEWTKDAFENFKNNDQDWTLERVFEVIIKAIILLIGLSLLRLPFYWIECLGIGVFEMAFPPFDTFFRIILKLITSIIYFIVCIVIALIVFKPYFINKKIVKKKESKNEKEIIKKQDSELKEEKEVIVQNSNNGIGRGFLEFGKGILFLCIVFPLFLIDFGCYVAISVLIFLLVEGIPVIGILLLMLSITIFFTFLTRFMYNLLYGKKHVYCYSLILSAILFVSGIFFSLHTIADFEVYNGLPNNTFKKTEIIYHEIVSNEYFNLSYWDYAVEVDDNLEDNEIDIIVSYYPDFVSDIKNSKVEYSDTTSLKLKTNYRSLNKTTRKKLYYMIREELKNLRWYHYSELGDLEIIVKANSKTISKIK